MEKKIELRNKNFQSLNISLITSDDNFKKRNKRLMLHRIQRAMDCSQILDENTTKFLDSVDFRYIRPDQALTLIDNLIKLMKNDIHMENCLQILGNLAAEKDIICEIMVKNDVLRLCHHQICFENEGVTEKAIWCIGNISLGSTDGKKICVNEGILHSIIKFLQSDYEKCDDTLAMCLWSIWCIIYKNSITQVISISLIAILIELIDYPSLQEPSLKLIYALSLQYPQNSSVAISVLCRQELYSHSSRLLCIEILKNVSLEMCTNNEIIAFLVSMPRTNSQVTISVYDLLFLITQVYFPQSIDLISFAIKDLNDNNLDICKRAARFLSSIGWIGQTLIIDIFKEEACSEIQSALRKEDPEIIHSLVNLSTILLNAGLVKQFIDTGCFEALSSAYFTCKNETAIIIAELFKEFFQDS